MRPTPYRDESYVNPFDNIVDAYERRIWKITSAAAVVFICPHLYYWFVQ